MQTYSTELTDTFGGEPNYSWVKRDSFSAPEGASRRTIVSRGKKALGLTGVRCQVEDWGAYLTIRPNGLWGVIGFITLQD